MIEHYLNNSNLPKQKIISTCDFDIDDNTNLDNCENPKYIMAKDDYSDNNSISQTEQNISPSNRISQNENMPLKINDDNTIPILRSNVNTIPMVITTTVNDCNVVTSTQNINNLIINTSINHSKEENNSNENSIDNYIKMENVYLQDGKCNTTQDEYNKNNNNDNDDSSDNCNIIPTEEYQRLTSKHFNKKKNNINVNCNGNNNEIKIEMNDNEEHNEVDKEIEKEFANLSKQNEIHEQENESCSVLNDNNNNNDNIVMNEYEDNNNDNNNMNTTESVALTFHNQKLRNEKESHLRLKIINELRPKIHAEIYQKQYTSIYDLVKSEIENELTKEVNKKHSEELTLLKTKQQCIQKLKEDEITNEVKLQIQNEYENEIQKEIMLKEKEIKFKHMQKYELYKKKLEKEYANEYEKKRLGMVKELDEIKGKIYRSKCSENLKINKINAMKKNIRAYHEKNLKGAEKIEKMLNHEENQRKEIEQRNYEDEVNINDEDEFVEEMYNKNNENHFEMMNQNNDENNNNGNKDKGFNLLQKEQKVMRRCNSGIRNTSNMISNNNIMVNNSNNRYSRSKDKSNRNKIPIGFGSLKKNPFSPNVNNNNSNIYVNIDTNISNNHNNIQSTSSIQPRNINNNNSVNLAEINNKIRNFKTSTISSSNNSFRSIIPQPSKDIQIAPNVNINNNNNIIINSNEEPKQYLISSPPKTQIPNEIGDQQQQKLPKKKNIFYSLQLDKSIPTSVSAFGKYLITHIEKEENFKTIYFNEIKKLKSQLLKIFSSEKTSDHCLIEYMLELWDKLEISYVNRYQIMKQLSKLNASQLYHFLDKETEYLTEYFQITESIFKKIKQRETMKSKLQLKINRGGYIGNNNKGGLDEITKEVETMVKEFKGRYLNLDVIWRGLRYEWFINYEKWFYEIGGVNKKE